METYESRYVYLDNIRTLLVYNVVFIHIMVMFSYPLTFWWPVIEKTAASRVYESLLLIMDIYLMPGMIFIAALFIFPSLNAKTTLGYIKKRFLRLFLPVMVYTFCAADIVCQITASRLGGSSPAYIRTFLDYWRDFIHFSVVTYRGEGKMLNQAIFALQHTWFLSFLFFMTLLTVLVSLVFRNKNSEPKQIDIRKKIVFKTIVFAVLSGLLYGALAIWYSINHIDFASWVRVFALVEVRISQFWMLLPLFLFGLYMYRKQWLTRDDIGSWKMWGTISFSILFILFFLVNKRMLPVIEEIVKAYEHNMTFTNKVPIPAVPNSFQLVYVIFNIMLIPACVFLLMFFLSLAKRFINSPSKIAAFCSKHSINVYILHFIPVVLLQYLFVGVAVPSMVKIIVIMIVVIPSCLWLSYRLVYPYPTAAISLFVLLKLVSLYTGFNFYYMALQGIICVSFAGAVLEGMRLVVTERSEERGIRSRG